MELRKRVVQGGSYLVARQSLGIVISLLGVILLTRLIGPSNYGLYSGALTITIFLVSVGRFGVDVYLLRIEETVDQSVFHAAFWYLLAAGLVVSLVTVAALRWGLAVVIDERFRDPLTYILPTIPLSLMAVPMTAQLERALNYRRVALIELLSQIAFYVVSVGLAMSGGGVWAPVTGYWVWQLVLLTMSFAATKFRPRFEMSSDVLADMLRYGFGYSSAAWIWQLRTLVNPIVVGSSIGPSAVAYVNLAVRLVELLSLVKTVLWRLSLSVMGKIQGDVPRLKRAVEEGMWVQVLAVGFPLAAFSTIGSWIIPALFGEEWSPVTEVFPFIAIAYLTNAMFNMHSSVLYVLRENSVVARFHVLHVVVFLVSAAVMVPSVGLSGYGIAELIAIPAYWALHLAVAEKFSLSYGHVWLWTGALGGAICSGFFMLPWSLILWLPVFLVALMPAQRHLLMQHGKTLMGRGA